MAIVVPLLRHGRVDFEGQYYSARECELVPRGPRPGGPPIWIAAFGPRMLRSVARWGDAFVTAWHTRPEALSEPFAALTAACAAESRDPSTVKRTIGTFVSLHDDIADAPGRPGREGLRGSPAEIAEGLLGLAAAGAAHITCMLSPSDPRTVERFARVIEEVARR